MRYFLSIATGLAVVALIALVFPLLQSQELVEERGASAELEKVVANLKTELDMANKGGAQLKAKLDETSAKIEQLRNELAAAKSQSTENQAHANQQLVAERQASQSQIDALNKTAEEGKAKLSEAERQIADLKKQLVATTADREAAQSKLSETQSQLDALNSELAKAKRAAEQANTKTRELEQAVTSANAEIERLKAELEQRSPPPVSVSPPSEDNPTPQ